MCSSDLIKCPDVRPDDGYNLKDMDSAAQFVISSRPAIALLAATTPPAPIPPPPTPVATFSSAPPAPAPAAAPYPPTPTPPATYAAQRYTPRPPFSGCRFCGASEHITPACQVRDEYAQLGKIRLNAGRAQMPDGADPFDAPYRFHGQFIKDRIDRWHLEHPSPTPPVVGSANLLAAANSAESYAAEQKKNTTAMPKSKQTPPIVNSPAAAASSSKGKDKERDAPAYKFRSPIDDATAPQRILDHLLSLPVTLSDKDIVTLSPLVQKELRQLVTTKRVDSASANEAAAIEADLPEFPEDPDGPVEVLIATTKPIESLRAIDAILGGKVKCECVVDNGSEMVVIRRDKWEQTGSRYVPSRKILMETANNSSNWTLGITENLTLTIGGLTVCVLAQVVEDAPYEVLLGRPLLTLLSANTQDHPDGRQDITFTCPETGAKTFVQTRARIRNHACGTHMASQGF